MKRTSLYLCTASVLFLLVGCAPTSGPRAKGEEKDIESFPVIGATYQLDRARFNNGNVVICTSEKAVEEYAEAERASDQKAMDAMIVDKNDIDQVSKKDCCIAISSYSQATIIEKGTSAHKAKFAAWPFRPMWAYYTAFGGVVKSGQ